jgi:hypothetical protein
MQARGNTKRDTLAREPEERVAVHRAKFARRGEGTQPASSRQRRSCPFGAHYLHHLHCGLAQATRPGACIHTVPRAPNLGWPLRQQREGEDESSSPAPWRIRYHSRAARAFAPPTWYTLPLTICCRLASVVASISAHATDWERLKESRAICSIQGVTSW